MKYVPHDYQSFATGFILEHPVAAILLQMGLGKSVITLTAIRELIRRGEVRRVLVIAPLRVARDTWPEEIRKWDHLKDLTFTVAVGTPEERRAALLSGAQVTILNRENVTWAAEASVLQHGECLPCYSSVCDPLPKSEIWTDQQAVHPMGNCDRRAGRKFDYDMIVIDELSSFKSWQAKRFRSLLKVRPMVKRIVGLTGTPSPNGLMDLFAEYRLLDMGERLGRSVSRYREAYFLPDRYCFNRVVTWKPRPGAEEEIYRKIGDITVSMKSVDHLKMPECVINLVPVYMDEQETALYETMKEELFLSLPSFCGDPKGFQGAFSRPLPVADEGRGNVDKGKPPEVVIDAKNASVLCGKLSQMANGAVYTEDGLVARIHDRKLDALEDLVEAANGNPLLVAYWYQHDLDRIRERFPEVRPLKTAQDMADWNAGKIPLAAVHPASAGHGLNLQAGGNQLVWFGLTWSLELYQQTNARLWRQGQQAETVVIHHIITEGTIDRQMMGALSRKDRTQEALIDAVRFVLRHGAHVPENTRR